MKDLVEFMARNIVDNPDQVEVTEEEVGGRLIYKLKVAETDRGKIIGREGRVVNAMRLLLRVAATKKKTQANIEII